MGTTKSTKYLLIWIIILIIFSFIFGIVVYKYGINPTIVVIVISILVIITLFPIFLISQNKFEEVLKQIAQELGLKEDLFLFDGKLPNELAWKFPFDYLTPAIGGIYDNYFARVGKYLQDEGSNRSYTYTYIIIMPKEFYAKHEEIHNRLKELQKSMSFRERIKPKNKFTLLVDEFRSLKGEALQFNNEQLNDIRDNEIPKHYTYNFKFGIFERAVVLGIYGEVLDKDKLLDYINSAVELMKYTKYNSSF